MAAVTASGWVLMRGAESKARGVQIHLGPSENRGSGGTVPRPTKDGFPGSQARMYVA